MYKVQKTKQKTCYQPDRTVGFDLAFPLLLHLVCASLYPCWQAPSCIYRCFKVKADRLDYPLPSAADVKRNSRPRLTAGKTAEQLSRLHSRAAPPGPQCQPLTRRYCTYTAVSHNEDKKQKKKEKTRCLLVQRYFTAPRSSDTRRKLPITLKMNISKPPS